MAPFRLCPWAVLPAVLWAALAGAQSGDDSGPNTPRWWSSAVAAPEAGAPVFSSQQDFSSLLSPQARQWGGGRLSMPFTTEERQRDAGRSVYSRALSIQWQHQADTDNRYTVSARRDNAQLVEKESGSTSGLNATFAWQRSLSADTRLTSRVFMGDEETRSLASGQWERRYFGLALEGRYQLGSRHAPFATFNWQRSGYEALEGASWMYGNGRWENRSQFSAGWSYQPLPNLDFRAEASLRFSEDAVDPADNDRSRLYFSTQYGFR